MRRRRDQGRVSHAGLCIVFVMLLVLSYSCEVWVWDHKARTKAIRPLDPPLLGASFCWAWTIFTDCPSKICSWQACTQDQACKSPALSVTLMPKQVPSPLKTYLPEFFDR